MSIHVPVTHVFTERPGMETLRRMRFAEYADNGIENLVLGEDWMHALLGRPRGLGTLQRDLKDFHLKFCDAHAAFGIEEDIHTPIREQREFLLSRFESELELCAACGVTTITIHTGNPPVPVPESEGPALLDRLKENIRRAYERLLPRAEKLGITICTENIWTPLNTADFLLELVHTFRSPNFGICFDAGHANLTAHRTEGKMVREWWEGYGPVRWNDRVLEMLLPEIVSCHLHDNSGEHDEHKLPGDGTIDWSKVVAALRKAPRLKVIQDESLLACCHSSVRRMAETYRNLFA